MKVRAFGNFRDAVRAWERQEKGQESIKETYTEEELQRLLQKPLGNLASAEVMLYK